MHQKLVLKSLSIKTQNKLKMTRQSLSYFLIYCLIPTWNSIFTTLTKIIFIYFFFDELHITSTNPLHLLHFHSVDDGVVEFHLQCDENEILVKWQMLNGSCLWTSEALEIYVRGNSRQFLACPGNSPLSLFGSGLMAVRLLRPPSTSQLERIQYLLQV